MKSIDKLTPGNNSKVASLTTSKHTEQLQNPVTPYDKSTYSILGAFSGGMLSLFSAGALGLDGNLGGLFLNIATGVIAGALTMPTILSAGDMKKETKRRLGEMGFNPEDTKKLQTAGFLLRKGKQKTLINPKTGLEVTLRNFQKCVLIESTSYRPALEAWDDAMATVSAVYSLPGWKSRSNTSVSAS